jgi:hypothetical protein
MRWRAPELALLMADHASAAAAASSVEPVRLRAEVLAVFACNQLGRGAEAGGRAIRALRAAQQAGDETTERLVRVELAACAADASAPSAGLTVLQPVFGRVTSAAPTARAAAMVTAADCVARLGGGPDVEALLTCADQLYDLSSSVEPDAVRLRRGMVYARLAAYHRRRGDRDAAESTARAGLALVEGLSDGELDTGQVSGALMLELALALLDSGRVPEAVVAAQPVLQRPARPAGAAAACWLRLALVSRVHLPSGRHALARRLLGEAAADAGRNHLDVVLAECGHLQAQVHEMCAELGEALQSVRAAYAADRRWRDTAAELRTTLAAEFGPPPPAAELRSALAEVLATSRPGEASSPHGRGRPARSRHAAPTPLPVGQAAESSRSSAAPSVSSIEAVPQPVPLTRPAAPHPMLAHPPPVPAQPQPRPVPAQPYPPPVPAQPQPRPVLAHPSPPPVHAHPDPQAVLAHSSPPPMQARLHARSSAAPMPQPAGAAAPDVVAPSLSVAAYPSPAVADRLSAMAPMQPVDVVRHHAADSPEPLKEPGASKVSLVEPLPEPPARTAPQDRAEPLEQPAMAQIAWEAVKPKPPAAGETAAETATPDRPDAPAATITRDEPGEDEASQPGTNGFDRGPGRHRSDVAMADLLALALMAYQDGQQSDNGTPTAATPESRDVRKPRRSSAAALELATAVALGLPIATEPSESQEPFQSSQLPESLDSPESHNAESGTSPESPDPPPAKPVRLIDMPRELVWREPGRD